jgi:response regulator RpfG family c-di-GMP phosphodiesterase
MQRHSEIGGSIVQTHEAMTEIARIVRHHHERYDGAGYPDRLAGDDIPLGARIISVADAFSAMTNNRVYRKAISEEQAWEEIHRNSGSQFDPAIVELYDVIAGADAPPINGVAGVAGGDGDNGAVPPGDPPTAPGASPRVSEARR